MKGRATEKGATLVEIGIVLPFLIALAIGLAEVGFLVIDYITITNATRSGARTGSSAADIATADDLILNVVEEASCNLRFGNLEEVVIYRAEADGSQPLDLNYINQYVNPGDLASLDCDMTSHGLANGTNCCPWAAASRDRVPPTFDTLGVEVTFSHQSVTGLLPFPTVTWKETAVMQIEPDTSGTQ